MVHIAVGRVVVVVEVAGKAQLGIKESIECAELAQAVALTRQTLGEPHLQPVEFGHHALQIQIGLGILRDADGRFHQRKVVIALHQRSKVLQGRGVLINRPAHKRLCKLLAPDLQAKNPCHALRERHRPLTFSLFAQQLANIQARNSQNAKVQHTCSSHHRRKQTCTQQAV